MSTPTHGGPRPGAGRHPNPWPSRRLVLHATEEEYQQVLAALTPRQRTEVLLEAVEEEE